MLLAVRLFSSPGLLGVLCSIRYPFITCTSHGNMF